MIDKIKSFLASIGSIILLILGGIAAMAIYILTGKNNKLENELKSSKAESDLQKTKDAQEKVDEKAKSDTSDYDKLLAEYRSKTPPSQP